MNLNINNIKPRTVIFDPEYSFHQWGGCRDPEGVLGPNKEYQATKIEVHTWHTRVFLDGIDGYFSSTAFLEKEGKE